MKTKSTKSKILAMLLAVCMVVALAPITVLADGVNYIDEIHVAYTHVNYKAGEAPHATANVTSGNCTVAYEYWREIYQKEEGGVWSGTGRYWYSDPDKMASLSADKRITQFEAGKHYSYNIVLVTNSGYFISEDTTKVYVGDYEWGTPSGHTNLEIKEMSTKLYIYSPYSIDIPEDNTDKVITAVSITGVNKDLSSSTPVTFTATPANSCADKLDITEEAWELGANENGANDIIKSTEASPRAPIAGGKYWYSIVLTAKDGYVFSKDFDDNHRIKEGSKVIFAVGGTMYDGRFDVSEDGKTLTAWEFMDPVTVYTAPTTPDYKIIEGANSAWSENTDGTLTFRANGDFSKFTEVKVDGKTISPDKYTAASGSTIVTLKADYLNTLSSGKHTLTVVYNDGDCSAEFEIKAAPNNKISNTEKTNVEKTETVEKPAKTNDGNNLVLWTALLLVSGGTVAGTIKLRRKTNEQI